MRRIVRLAIATGVCVLWTACQEPTNNNANEEGFDSSDDTGRTPDPNTDADSDTNADTRGDTDTHPSADSDTGSEVAGDSDTDTPRDTDSTAADTERDTTPDPDTDSDSEAPPLKKALPNLIVAESCDGVWEVLKKSIVEAMERALQLAEENAYAAIDNRCMYDADAGADGDTDADTDADADSDSDADGPDEYSETNTQVAGVDEADFIKNDGAYIYILADNSFQIIDAWPAAEAVKLSATPVEGTPKKLFVYGDRAVIYASLEPLQTTDYTFNARNGECTYGYDCDFTGDGSALEITVWDISDRTAPALIRQTTMPGSYLNSRRIDNSIYTMAVFPALQTYVTGLQYWPEELPDYWDLCSDPTLHTKEDIAEMFENLRTKNLAIIDAFELSDFLPALHDTRYVDGESVEDVTLLKRCEGFNVAQTGDGQNLLVLLGFDIDALDPLKTTSIVSRPGAVYADADSLYVATRHYRRMVNGWFFEDASSQEATTIHKFRLIPEESAATYIGSGVVKGRVLNQFSMDEHGEHLRIATTTGTLPSLTVHSTVSVLAEDEDRLELVGQIDDIAPTEDIRSVRFNGDVGFVVTYRETDPLFVLDLSSPQAPTIRGELKIPGFSTYMHMMDDTHILSIGYDTPDLGARFQGIQLQVLDVTDLANPLLVHKEVIGTRGSTSDATTNHLAFNYLRSLNRLAIPMAICEQSSGYDDLMTFSGLLVYEVTTEGGFQRLGGIPHETPETQDTYYGACDNWWTKPNSKVKRSIFMDEYVYSVAMDRINISDIADLEHPVTAIELIREEVPDVAAK